MVHTEVPDGYHIEWHPDEEWSIAAVAHLCSKPHCPHTAVAVFLRRFHHYRGDRMRRYHYCADHMYGREIRGGVVMCDRLVPNSESETRTGTKIIT